MLGKCYLYALETFFDLYAGLSSGTMTIATQGSAFAIDGASTPNLTIPELGNCPVLVHGFVLGDSGDLKDKKFGHAWLEGNGYVVDCGSAEKEHTLVGREQYYDHWRINTMECHRYTIEQAAQHIVATGWDSGWNASPPDVFPVKPRQIGDAAGRPVEEYNDRGGVGAASAFT